MKKMYTKEQLLKMVKKLYEDDSKTAFGEQVGGGKEMPKKMIDRFFEKTGKYCNYVFDKICG